MYAILRFEFYVEHGLFVYFSLNILKFIRPYAITDLVTEV